MKNTKAIEIAKKSTFIHEGEIWQLFHEGKQVLVGQKITYTPKPRTSGRGKGRKQYQPPERTVKIQWPLNRPPTFVMVETVDNTKDAKPPISFSAPVDRLGNGCQWVNVTKNAYDRNRFKKA